MILRRFMFYLAPSNQYVKRIHAQKTLTIDWSFSYVIAKQQGTFYKTLEKVILYIWKEWVVFGSPKVTTYNIVIVFPLELHNIDIGHINLEPIEQVAIRCSLNGLSTSILCIRVCCGGERSLV